MAEFVCTAEMDAAGVERALLQAVPGDVINVEAGEFWLADTLHIPDGVTLKGAGKDQTTFLISADKPAIAILEKRDVTLEAFSVKSAAEVISPRVLPSNDPVAPDTLPNDKFRVEWGLVWINQSQAIRLCSLSIFQTNANAYLGGLYIRASQSVSIEKNSIRGFGKSGVSFLSSQECQIEQCELVDNQYGIALAHSLANPDQPSRAQILGNRCHGNKDAGIVLFSSESDDLRENECWDNGDNGIALARDAESSDDLSRAQILGNRCHGNKGAGIVLFSSESDDLRENECWDNGASGIALVRGSKSPDAPSRAKILGNRCHGNERAGIVLFSSESDDLRENECWDNGTSGIVLQRSSDSPDDLSRAQILGNRCHRNERAFVVDIEAKVEQDTNLVAGNQEQSMYLATDRRTLLNPLDWRLQVFSETAEEALSRQKFEIVGGELAVRLFESGNQYPAKLARTVSCIGGISCLWNYLPLDWVPDREENEASDRPWAGLYSLKMEDRQEEGISFVARSTTALAPAVWEKAKRHVLNQSPGVFVIGAFGDVSKQLDAIVEDAVRVNGYDLDRHTSGKPVPTGSTELIRALYDGTKIGKPLDIDCTSRSLDALQGEQSSLPFLEPDYSTTSDKWRGRIGFFFKQPVLWLQLFATLVAFAAIAVGVGAFKGFPDPIGDPLGAIYQALWANINDLQLQDIAQLPLVLLGVPAALFAVINRYMPAHLKFSLPHAFRRGGSGQDGNDSSQRGGPGFVG